MFRGWNWNKYWGQRIFSAFLSLPTPRILTRQASTEGLWVTGISHPRCKSDHGGHVCVCKCWVKPSPRDMNSNKSSFLCWLLAVEKWRIFNISCRRTTDQNSSKQYAPFITFFTLWTCVGVHFCRCNTDVVKALYWIIFMKFVWVFYEKGWKSLFTPPGFCCCLPFDGYLWQYTTCSRMD